MNNNARTFSNAEIEQLKKEQTAIWEAKGYTCREFNAINYLLLGWDANAIIEDVCHHTQTEYDCMEATILIDKILDGWSYHVEPLLSAIWGQGYPYNQQITNGYPAGCVATAMAQIMNYHQWPARYNWAYMNTSYPNIITSFFKDIENSVHMSYGTNGSFASNQNACNALVNNYDYRDELIGHYDEKVNKNLAKSLPVYMAGDDGNEGHAWVCDGVQVYQYGKEVSTIMLFPIGKPNIMGETCYYVGCINQYITDYYHINWGWDQ